MEFYEESFTITSPSQYISWKVESKQFIQLDIMKYNVTISSVILRTLIHDVRTKPNSQ